MTSPLDPTGDVSVVLVAYRSPRVLVECLASFERHRPARVGELLLIDNSADGSLDPVAARFAWASRIVNADNLHFRAGCNQGARWARGPYLLLLNPDTYLTDSVSLARLADVLDRRSDVGFVGPTIRGEDGRAAPQGEPISGLAQLVAMKTHLNALWPDNPLGNRRRARHLPPRESGSIPTATAAALLCRREQFLAVGGFDERARAYWEEHELARKLRLRGLHGYYCAEASVVHRWRQGGTLEDAARSRAEYERSLRLYYEESFGLPGRILFSALDAPAAAARLVRRLRAR